MLKVDLTPAMIREAARLDAAMGELRNSIRQGQGNVAGILGELAFLKAYPEAVRIDSYDFDILLNGKRVEIKTKDRTVQPKPHHECSVSNYNATQKTDFYFFVSLYRTEAGYQSAYLLGYLSPDEFFARARHLRAGEIDPSNGYTVRADCYNVRIDELNPIPTQSEARTHRPSQSPASSS